MKNLAVVALTLCAISGVAHAEIYANPKAYQDPTLRTKLEVQRDNLIGQRLAARDAAMAKAAKAKGVSPSDQKFQLEWTQQHNADPLPK